MTDDHHIFLREAFNSYLHQLNEGELEPTEAYLPYDLDNVDARQWIAFGREMVKDEFRETTNKLNYWHHSLVRWDAWNNVISRYKEKDAWKLRGEFLEGSVHHCLLMPSSIRDTLTFVATNSMHQVLLSVDDNYKDYLDGDPKSPSEKPKFLTRSKKEKRLNKLVSRWPIGSEFMSALRKIDDEAYRKATSNYRNLNTHSIGPRLGIGMTRAVVRSVKQATTMSEQADGTYLPTPIPEKMSVSYEFGGMQPLNMEEARVANLEQYQRARDCFVKYRDLLHTGFVEMPLAQPEN